MARDDIIRMAREAGITAPETLSGVIASRASLERFVTLIAAHEREECAKVCESARIKGGEVFAAKIRARGET